MAKETDKTMDSALIKSEQKKSLSSDVMSEAPTVASKLRKKLSKKLDTQTIDFSNAIYGWGSSVYHGISGKTAKSASGSLNRLSSINGIDDGVLSIKEVG